MTSPEPAYTATPPARLAEPLHSNVKRVHHHGPGLYHGIVRIARHCFRTMVAQLPALTTHEAEGTSIDALLVAPPPWSPTSASTPSPVVMQHL